MEFQYHIFSPYRVCPLGAHVDHQHGIVTGFAIDKGVDLWFTPNEDGRCIWNHAPLMVLLILTLLKERW